MFLVSGFWFLVYDLWFMVEGAEFRVRNLCSLLRAAEHLDLEQLVGDVAAEQRGINFISPP